MIVDCHTHIWDTPDQLGEAVRVALRTSPPTPASQRPDNGVAAGVQRHLTAAEPVDLTFVVGFRSYQLGAHITNESIATYVAGHPDRLVGFAGIDPSSAREAIDEVQRAHDELGMRGIAVAPPAQGFHPSNSQAMLVYARAAELKMPVLFSPGLCMLPQTRLEYARPLLLDEIAREMPELRMLIAHLGYPWVQDTAVLLAKHANVYAEISGLLHMPWQAYQALMTICEMGAMEKILFGSGFPFACPAECIERLFEINHLCQGTNFPVLPRDHLRGVLNRDALAALGIEWADATRPASETSAALDAPP